jgi:NAD+ synthase (glutamine-hydrolysing)
MRRGQEFFNLYSHDLVRVAVGVPRVRVADPAFNAAETIALMEQAAREHAVLAVFPELGLSAYSCEDLFHQEALLTEVLDGLQRVVEASRSLPLVAVVGAPLRVDGLLFNCAVVTGGGRILGAAPKTYLPNYREFYEFRHFVPSDAARSREISLCGQSRIPFGSDLLFQFAEQPLLTFFVEICEDLWVPVPPSSHAALAGATVLLNLSASNIIIGKADYRRELVCSQSGRCLAGYLYAAAGAGESTTDLAWDGHGMIGENGVILAESRRFRYEPELICSEIDLGRLAQERTRQTSFGQAVVRHQEALGRFRTVPCPGTLPDARRLLPRRSIERFPYVPSDAARRDERCQEVYHIQVQGLVQRLQATGIQRVVIGVSGGLDSTHALLVCAEAMDVLGFPRNNILGYTMPGFATGAATLEQARKLMRAIGCEAHEVDIRPACARMLEDIGHPFSRGEKVYDATFENVQAGQRTSLLFRAANLRGGLVVGTSDLSELALGWCTYGVGDQMSHYAVNASVPKTLIQHLVRWVAQTQRLGAEASATLRQVLAGKISPELIPADGAPQHTESAVGPFELQDFNLYYILRFGFPPSKVAFLAYCAWRDAAQGTWPADLAEHHEYGIGQIKSNLSIFLKRFFQTSQFKRSALPNAPKVGSGGSLSPRSDYRAPSDSEAAAWLRELELVPDHE